MAARQQEAGYRLRLGFGLTTFEGVALRTLRTFCELTPRGRGVPRLKKIQKKRPVEPLLALQDPSSTPWTGKPSPVAGQSVSRA
jgi:hypothetical protein